MKFLKTKEKEKILNAAGWGRCFACRGTRIKIIPEFSSEATRAVRQWDDMFKALREKHLST